MFRFAKFGSSAGPRKGHRPSSGYRPLRIISLVVVAVILGVTEMVSQYREGIAQDDVVTVFLGIGMCVAIALLGPFPKLSGALYMVFACAEGLINTDLSLPALGTYIIAMDWIAHSWYMRAFIFLVLNEALTMMNNEFSLSAMMNSALGIGAAVAIGLTIQNAQKTALLAKAEASLARAEAREKISGDLSSELHGTVARELTSVVLAAEMLSRDPGSRELIAQIQAGARNALANTRSLIADLDHSPGSESLTTVLTQCQRMLTVRNISLYVEGSEVVIEKLSQSMRDTLMLVIKEGTTNILKYGLAGSQADLVIEQQDQEDVFLTLSNVCGATDAEGSRSLLSGGFGLENLAARLSNEGGKLTYMKVNDRWVLVAEIHGGQPTMPLSDATASVEISTPAPLGPGRSTRNDAVVEDSPRR